MSTNLIKIILVEDHDSLRIVTADMLRQHGYSVAALSCAEELDDEAGGEFVDIFILDLNLPDEDGISLSQRIRKSNPNVGIIMVTARNSLEDRVIGYESGADIYLVKPVEPAELLATISSLSRRIELPVDSNLNALKLDLKQLILQGNKGNVHVNKAEAIILQGLARAKNQQLDYWQLIESIGESENPSFKKATLEVKIHRLRHKIFEVSDNQYAIKSIRDQGYHLCMTLIIL